MSERVGIQLTFYGFSKIESHGTSIARPESPGRLICEVMLAVFMKSLLAMPSARTAFIVRTSLSSWPFPPELPDTTVPILHHQTLGEASRHLHRWSGVRESRRMISSAPAPTEVVRRRFLAKLEVKRPCPSVFPVCVIFSGQSPIKLWMYVTMTRSKKNEASQAFIGLRPICCPAILRNPGRPAAA
jgi:hypothetical protein